MVAFFLHTGGARNPALHSAALAWNPINLGYDLTSPTLAFDRITNVDAILEVTDVLGLDATEVANGINWFHFGIPQATNFLMVAKLEGEAATSTVSFAMPSGALFDEVSTMRYGRKRSGYPVADVTVVLDGATIFPTVQANNVKAYAFISPFQTLDIHDLSITHSYYRGSSGVALVFLYHVP